MDCYNSFCNTFMVLFEGLKASVHIYYNCMEKCCCLFCSMEESKSYGVWNDMTVHFDRIPPF